MKAVVITEPGGPEVLKMMDRPEPALLPHHVLVRVKIARVNRADLLQRLGMEPTPAGVVSDIPGLEYMGVVEKCGEGVTRFKNGMRAFGIVPGGSYAELVCVHEREAVAVPDE